MRTVVGIFTSRADAERALRYLRSIGFGEDKINFLTPGASKEALEAVPTTETEQPGMGRALGTVVGGVAGATGATAAASLLIPGIGPVVALGVAAAALLGAAGGATVGGALENSLSQGLPKDELFVYEDALRQGRSVVVVLADEGVQADAVRNVLAQAGAEGLDVARERWWIGQRHAEEERYLAQGRDFKADERAYRRGFEAALHPVPRGKPYEEVREYLRERYPDVYHEEAFRRGYERGQAYYRDLMERYRV